MRLNLKRLLFGNLDDEMVQDAYVPEVEIKTEIYDFNRVAALSSCSSVMLGTGTAMLARPISVDPSGSYPLPSYYEIWGDTTQPRVHYQPEKVKCLYCDQWNHSYSLCCEFCGGRLT